MSLWSFKTIMKSIFAIIISYKDYVGLEASLVSLKRIYIPQGYTLHTIIVDQCSRATHLKPLSQKFPKEIYIKEKQNLGVGGAFNKGINYAKSQSADYYFLLTGDIVMEQTVLEKLLPKLNASGDVGVVSPLLLINSIPLRILFAGGTIDKKVHSSILFHTGKKYLKQFIFPFYSDILSCPILVKKEVIEKVSYFNEAYFMYYEDIDWYLKVKKAGYKLLVVPTAKAFTGEATTNPLSLYRKEYYLSRNLLLFNKYTFSTKERIRAYIAIYKNLFLQLPLLFSDRKKDQYYRLLGLYDFLRNKKGYKNFNI